MYPELRRHCILPKLKIYVSKNCIVDNILNTKVPFVVRMLNIYIKYYQGLAEIPNKTNHANLFALGRYFSTRKVNSYNRCNRFTPTYGEIKKFHITRSGLSYKKHTKRSKSKGDQIIYNYNKQ